MLRARNWRASGSLSAKPLWKTRQRPFVSSQLKTHQLSSLISSSGFFVLWIALTRRAWGYNLRTCSNWFEVPSAKKVAVSFTEAIVITELQTESTRALSHSLSLPRMPPFNSPRHRRLFISLSLRSPQPTHRTTTREIPHLTLLNSLLFPHRDRTTMIPLKLVHATPLRYSFSQEL